MNAFKSLAAIFAMLCAASPLSAGDPPPAPRNPAMAGKDGFGALQLATINPPLFMTLWRQNSGDVSLPVNSATVRNQPITTYILFKGCTRAEDGNCYVTAEFSIYDPTGKLYGYHKGIPLWKSTKPPGRAYSLGDETLGLKVENGEKLGTYTIRVRTTDEVARITVETEQLIAVTEATNAAQGGTR